MQCNEVLTPLGLVAFFVLLFVLIVACGVEVMAGAKP